MARKSRGKARSKTAKKYSKNMGKRRGRSRRGRRTRMKGGSLLSVLNKALLPAALFSGSKYLQKRSKRKSTKMNFKRLKNTLRNKRRKGYSTKMNFKRLKNTLRNKRRRR